MLSRIIPRTLPSFIRISSSLSSPLSSLSLSNHRLFSSTTPSPSSPSSSSSVSSSSSSTNTPSLLHTDVGTTSFMPDEFYQRSARIYRLPQNVMHSEPDDPNWRIDFPSTDKWINPLMGWTSSNDPGTCITLRFPTKEEAIAFAIQEGLKYEIVPDNEKILRSKSYATRFKWRGPAEKASKKHPYDSNLDADKQSK